MRKIILAVLLNLLLFSIPLSSTTLFIAPEAQAQRDFSSSKTKKNGPRIPAGMKFLPANNKKPKTIQKHVINELLPRAINFLLIATMSVSVIVIIIGGIYYVISAGETEKTGKAKTMILWALVGLIVALLAYSMIRIVTGIELIEK